MTDQDITTRIQAELAILEIEDATLNYKYKNVYHFGEGTFDLLPDMERVRKRRVELEDTLRIMEEFK
jgi:hypothetical protein